jgi:hypothetical protein
MSRTAGKTTIYQSVNHGPNIQPAAHRVWYTLISLGLCRGIAAAFAVLKFGGVP